MGKGTITGNGSAGAYSVAIKYARGNVDDRISAIDEAILDLESQIDEKQDEVDEKQGEIDGLEQSIATLLSEISTLNSEIEVLSESLTTIQSEIDSAQETVDFYEAEIIHLEATLAGLYAQKTSYEGQINYLQSQIDALQSEESCNADISDLNGMISGLNSDIDIAQSAIDILITDISNKQSEINTLQSELDALNDAFDTDPDRLAKQAEVDAKQAEVDAKQNEIDTLQSELDTLQSELDSNPDDIINKQTEIDNKQTEIYNKQTEIYNKQTENEETFSDTRSEKVDEINTIESEIETLDGEVDNLQVGIDSIQNQIDYYESLDPADLATELYIEEQIDSLNEILSATQSEQNSKLSEIQSKMQDMQEKTLELSAYDEFSELISVEDIKAYLTTEQGFIVDGVSQSFENAQDTAADIASSIEVLNSQISVSNTERSNMQSVLDDPTSTPEEVIDANIAIDQLTHMIEDYEDELESNESNLEAAGIQEDILTESLNIEIDLLNTISGTSNIEDSDGVISFYESVLEDFDDDIATLDESIAVAQGVIDSIESEISDVDDEITVKTAVLEAVQDTLDVLNSDPSSTPEEILAAEAALFAAQEDLDDSLTEKVGLETSLVAPQAILYENTIIRDLKQSKYDDQSVITDAYKDADDILTDGIKDLEIEKTELETEKSELETEKSELETRAEELPGEISSKQGGMNTADGEKSILDAELIVLNGELVVIIDALNAVINDKQSEIDTANGELSDLNDDKDGYESDIEGYESEISGYESDIEDLEAILTQHTNLNDQIDYLQGLLDTVISSITSIGNSISSQESSLSGAQSQLDGKNSEMSTALSSIAEKEASVESKTDEVESKENALIKLSIPFGKIASALNVLKIGKLSLEKQKDRLEEIPETEGITTTWCADYTDDLSGDVGIIEVPGESNYFNVQPGYGGNAAYSQYRDGQLMPTMAMTPAQAFYNLAMLPGWQKWRPTYRYATINSINYDNDTANLTIQSIKSSQQNINIDQSDSLSNVPITYMDCNAEAFEAGDIALVKFTGQQFENPVVIGFKSNPKPCEDPGDGSLLVTVFGNIEGNVNPLQDAYVGITDEEGLAHKLTDEDGEVSFSIVYGDIDVLVRKVGWTLYPTEDSFTFSEDDEDVINKEYTLSRIEMQDENIDHDGESDTYHGRKIYAVFTQYSDSNRVKTQTIRMRNYSQVGYNYDEWPLVDYAVYKRITVQVGSNYFGAWEFYEGNDSIGATWDVGVETLIIGFDTYLDNKWTDRIERIEGYKLFGESCRFFLDYRCPALFGMGQTRGIHSWTHTGYREVSGDIKYAPDHDHQYYELFSGDDIDWSIVRQGSAFADMSHLDNQNLWSDVNYIDWPVISDDCLA